VLAFTHLKDAGGRVVPGAVTVIGMDMVLARVPTARPRVGPALELHVHFPALTAFHLDLCPEDAVLRAAPGDDLVGACRQQQLSPPMHVEVHPSACETVERTQGREEL